jgi:hypothetical protein
MSAAQPTLAEGGCTCRAVRFSLTGRPLIVHCCHCRWCQRESGGSFALNAVKAADGPGRPLSLAESQFLI